MSRPSPLNVLFVAAAGPRLGYGHLVRSGILASAMGVKPHVALRASSATRQRARALGWRVHRTMPTLVRTMAPDLIVIDDPSSVVASRWARAGRERHIPVVAISDFGLGRTSADLTIDGSLVAASDGRGADLQGPNFAILDPVIDGLRRQQRPRAPRQVVIALGGGSYVRGVGCDIARQIRTAVPDADVLLAPGFGAATLPALPAGCRWLERHALRSSLATAALAVVAGGITLYETCALGTPMVALPLTRAQASTTAAAAARGAAVDVTLDSRHDVARRAADEVAALLSEPDRARTMGIAAGRLVDGRGTDRVMAHLRALVSERSKGGTRDAA